MTKIKINTAIAKLCGWKPAGVWWTHPSHPGQTRDSIPSYATSLDAMHEAEKTLTYTAIILKPFGFQTHQRFEYLDRLAEAVFRDKQGREYNASDDYDGQMTGWDVANRCTYATAAQRAEAFLRVHNKWKK